MNWFTRIFASKESQARVINTINQVGKPVHTPADYEGLAKRGYAKNVVVFTSVSKIATACSGIKWLLYSKNKGKLTEITEHPLLILLDKPNPLQPLAGFIESVIAYKEITGNSYIEKNKPYKNRPPLEIWSARPDKMKIVPGVLGYPSRYEFTANGKTKSWEVNQVSLQSDIIHWKSFNPLNDWYGMSPLQAAMLSLDQNNQGQNWNLSLLQNSATPSGVLQMKVSDANPRGELTPDQYVRLKNEFEESYQGSRNAGRPMVIEGGLNWTAISLSPKDMEFIQNKNVTAQDICLAFGVPPELMGLGTKTFANYKEARLAFYMEKILPTMDALRDQLNLTLVPDFGDNLYLDYDKDSIEAITEAREARFTSLNAVTFLDENEKRAAVGYEAVEGFNVFKVGQDLVTREMLLSLDDEVIIDETDNSTQNQPPQKPTGSENDDEGNSQDDIDDSEESGKSFKSINLVTSNEKRKSYRKQNAIRKRLASDFRRNIQEDYRELISDLKSTANSLKKSDPKVIEYGLQTVVSEWTKQLSKTLARYIRLTLNEFGGAVLNNAKDLGLVLEIKQNLKYDSFVLSYIERRTGDAISTISQTNQKQVTRIVKQWVAESIINGDSQEDLSFYLQTEFEGLSKSNARRIANTEVGMASTQGSLEAVKSLQIPNMEKEWVWSDSTNPRDGEPNDTPDHRSLDGSSIPLDEKFLVPPDCSMDGPGDPSAGPEQLCYCHCVLVYKSKNNGVL